MNLDLTYNELKLSYQHLKAENENLRRQAEVTGEALAAYSQIVENANSAIVRLSLKGDIGYMNQFAQEIFNRGSSALVGRNVFELIPASVSDSIQKVHKVMDDLLLRNLNLSQTETSVILPDNQTIWISWTSKLLYDNDAKPNGIIAIGTDITRRKNAEEALRESEYNLTKAQEIAGVGSWAWEIGTDTIHGSEYFFRIFNIHPVTSYQYLLKELSTIIHPEYREFIWTKIQRAISRGTSESYMYQITHPNGQHRWVLEEVSVLGNVGQKKQILIGTIRDITNQKLSEDKLREYLLIVSSSSELMSLINYEYRYINVNQSYLDVYGRKAGEIEGKTVAQIFGDEIFNNIIKPNIDRSLLGENVTDQYWFDFPKQGRRFMDTKYNPVREVDGTISGVTVSSRDITDLKKAEEQLRIFKLFAEESGIGLGMADLEGNITYANTTMCRLAGIKSPGEVIGHSVSKTYLNNHREKLINEIIPTIRERGQWTGEIDMIREDGEVIHTIENFFVIKNPQDEIVSYAISVTDITERKHAEKALQQSESNFRLIFTNAAIGIDVVDENGNFLQVNDALAKTMGYTAEELKKLSVLDITHPDDIERSKKPLNKLFADKTESYRIEKRYIRRDGSIFWADLSVSPFYDVANRGMLAIGTIIDITQSKALQDELQRSRENAIEANRAKSEFLANMSHEIRTPLNAVIGFTELLESMITDPKQMSYLESIKSGGKNLLLLINDILDLSKIEAGKLEFIYEPVNPYSLISEIKQIFALKIEEKNLDFIIDFDDEIPQSLILDEVRLRQVIFNLIGNAIKFTHEGFVKFSMKKIALENDTSKIDLQVSVEDTGIGIPAEEHQHIFEAFRQQSGQSNRKYGGTGLGLSISKRLVEMMHGEISLKSEPGVGSVFEFYLHNVDIGTGLRQKNETDDFDLPNFVFAPACILVVDDIESNRRLIIENFSSENIKVIEAIDGRNAVDLALKTIPDLIFMDIRMPVMDGFEAAKMLKSNTKTKKIPVIALTASIRRQDQDKAYAQYFDGYLQKPVSRNELYREMMKFLKYSQIRPTKQRKEKPSLSSKTSIKLKLSEQEAGELVQIFDEVLSPLFQEASEFQMSDGIEFFARNVKNTGEKFHVDELTKFGDDLIIYVDNFDLNKMDKALKDYPKIISQIKNDIKKIR